MVCWLETASSGPSGQMDGESQRTLQPRDPDGVVCTHTGKLAHPKATVAGFVYCHATSTESISVHTKHKW